MTAAFIAAILVGYCALSIGAPVDLQLPHRNGSVRFAVIGDSGTGADAQYDVGQQMAAFHQKFPYTFVIMLGDNIYGLKGWRCVRAKVREALCRLAVAWRKVPCVDWES